MKPCKFTFDDTPAFDGFAHGSKWNGFDNVAVTPEGLGLIVVYFRNAGDDETANDFAELINDPMENGMISLGWGWATQIVEPNNDTFQDVLDQLAANDGAIHYWQMPDVKRAIAAADACVVTLTDTDLLVHPDAVELEPGMSYTMKKES